MKIIKVSLVVFALAALGGCIAVPVGPGYYGGGNGYYAPAPPPVYYGPSFGFGYYGGRGGYGRGYR
jgi:hypothetical protein